MCSQLLSIQMRSFSTVVFYTQSIKFGVYGGFGWPGPFPASVYSRRRIEPSKRYCGWVGEDLARPRPVRGLASRGSLFVSLSALLALLAFYDIVFFFLSFLSLQRLHVLFPCPPSHSISFSLSCFLLSPSLSTSLSSLPHSPTLPLLFHLSLPLSPLHPTLPLLFILSLPPSPLLFLLPLPPSPTPSSHPPSLPLLFPCPPTPSLPAS